MRSSAADWVVSAAGQRQLVKDFADGSVCFDPLTGETRLLAPLAALLLERARDAGRVSAREVLDELREPEDDDEQLAGLAVHVDDNARVLTEAGLLAPC